MIEQGATLNLSPDVHLRLAANRTISVTGTLDLAAGSRITFAYVFNNITQIIVDTGGLLNLQSASLLADSVGSNLPRLVVNAGGQLTAADSVIELNRVNLEQGAIFNAGDLNGNAFDADLFLPAAFVPLLSAARGGADNLRFQDINITSTTLASGTTLNLDQIGTETTANLRYLFPDGQTIEQGATLNLSPDVHLRLEANRTISVAGTLDLAADSRITFAYVFNNVTQIVVDNGGRLNLQSASLLADSVGSNLPRLVVTAGGQLTATNTTFILADVDLQTGSLSDVTANSLGQSVTFGGAASSAELSNFTSIDVSNGASLVVPSSLRIDDDSILSVAPDSSLVVERELLGDTQIPAAYQPRGTLNLDGAGTAAAPQLIEAMSLDRGLLPTAFNGGFAIGALTIQDGNYVKLVDQSDNSAGLDPEAVYVNSIIIPAGATLDLNGLNLYARQVQQSGAVVGGSITQLADSGPLAFGVPTPGTISVAGELDKWTFYQRAGRSMVDSSESWIKRSLSSLNSNPRLGSGSVGRSQRSSHRQYLQRDSR